jgi:predicted molibdopterin-dependent oxidoreductase YjgC
LTSLHLTINGKSIQTSQGQTILQAAQQNGIDIPSLCAYEDLPPFGGCRMCVVEVDGFRGFPTACTTPAVEGMVVRTETAALKDLRLETLNLLISEHPLSCLVCPENQNCSTCMETIRKSGVTTGCGSCPKNDQCELQTMAHRLGIDDIRLPVKYRLYPVERYDPFYDRDYNLCILCGRCVQVCEKLHILNTLSFVERGAVTRIGTAFDRSHLESNCSFCGACVDRCPTGTLVEKTRKWAGVAEREVDSTCPFCAAGCAIRLQVKDGMVIGSLPGNDPSINAGTLCVHGRFGITELVNHAGRMRKPWHLRDGQKFEFSWEEALDLAAGKMAACQPGEALMQISADLPTEDLFIAQKFATHVLKSPLSGDEDVNPSSGFVRLARHAASFDQMREADCVITAGLDTRYTASWMEYELKVLKQNGATIIAINDGEYPVERFATTFLREDSGSPGRTLTALLDRITSPAGAATSPLEDAAAALRESRHPFILVGPYYSSQPEMVNQLASLAVKLNAGVICLPLEGNIFGAMRTGIIPVMENMTVNPAVLYSVGCRPATIAGYTIYQNAFAPGEFPVDLGLPSAMFSERDGSFINAETRLRPINKAVEPPGLALPDWQIIASIARRIGVAGFEYKSSAEIMEELLAAHPAESMESRKTHGSLVMVRKTGQSLVYLGEPLSSKVAGLRAIFPETNPKGGAS